MSNPFKDWTSDQVEERNRRVLTAKRMGLVLVTNQGEPLTPSFSVESHEPDDPDAAEADLQDEIRNYLNVKGICFAQQPMNKKSRVRPGWPDFTFAWNGWFVGLEAKSATGKQSEDQIKCEAGIKVTGGVYAVVRSLAEVRDILRGLEEKKI